jgi:hypothetical protein
MERKTLVPELRLTGMFLIISSVIFLVAATLYYIRFILELPMGNTPAFFLWERILVIAALLAVLLSFTQLKRVLEAAGDGILASMALVLFLAAAILAVVAETLSFPGEDIIYPPIVAYVVLSFLGQALFGLALLRTGLVPAWVGWVTVIWNMAVLVFLVVSKPQDMYYPWLHYITPLLIGIALLREKEPASIDAGQGWVGEIR